MTIMTAASTSDVAAAARSSEKSSSNNTSAARKEVEELIDLDGNFRCTKTISPMITISQIQIIIDYKYD